MNKSKNIINFVQSLAKDLASSGLGAKTLDYNDSKARETVLNKAPKHLLDNNLVLSLDTMDSQVAPVAEGTVTAMVQMMWFLIDTETNEKIESPKIFGTGVGNSETASLIAIDHTEAIFLMSLLKSL